MALDPQSIDDIKHTFKGEDSYCRRHKRHHKKGTSKEGVCGMSGKLRAITVAVDYTDLLSITLPYNRHHFSEYWIVTDEKTSQDPIFERLTLENSAKVVVTTSFYTYGARFNKWAALEQGLALMGRDGWICLLDADILWPRSVKITTYKGSEHFLRIIPEALEIETIGVTRGCLISPLRRMHNSFGRDMVPGYHPLQVGPYGMIPEEKDWDKFPIHRNVNEWAGYTQIFHAEDPVLLKRGIPWHEIDWTHAGSADSIFQAMWSRELKVRPPFEVLHLGEAGKNWYGRSTPYVDGTVPEGSLEKQRDIRELWEKRRKNRAEGKDPFDGERIPELSDD